MSKPYICGKNSILLHNSSFSFIQKHLHLSEVASTNDLAKQLAEENLVDQGYFITTDFQTKGRGQELKGWESERGKNILCSLVLTINLPIEKQLYLNISICLALYDFVKSYCASQKVNIKWPNDIYVNDKKVAGLLIENSVQGTQIKQSIIGMGININQQVFVTNKATSLANINGTEYVIQECIDKLLHNLECRYNQLLQGNFTELWQQYHHCFYRKNVLTSFMANNEQFEGFPIGIDEAGRLLVNTNNEIRVFNVKEIKWL